MSHHGSLDHLPPDLAGSPLLNADLAPVPPERRTWTTYNFAALWISMAHCIPTYLLAGGLVAQGMNWWQALLTIGLGNLIVLARASFGTAGANVPALLRALVACGWFGIQTYIGGEAVKTFVIAAWPGFAGLGGDTTFLGLDLPSLLTFLLFWALNIAIVLWGMNAVRVFENWAAPLVLVLAAWLLWWIVGRAGGVGTLLDRPSAFADLPSFWKVFVPSLTGMIGFWATLSLNIPDFTRYGRGQREQMLGQALGLPTTMVAFSAMAVVITGAAESLLKGVDPKTLWDPIVVLGHVTSASPPPGLSEPLIADGTVRMLVAVVALAGVAMATIATNIAANVVSPANDFANVSPRFISFRMGGVITGVLGILMMPWKLLANPEAYVFEWLVGYSALLGPIAGIMVVDYWILRRCTLDVPELYRPRGRFAGVNPVAIAALALGVAPNVPGFLKAVKVVGDGPGWADAIYPYAWFSGFAIAAVAYVVGMRIRPGFGISARGRADA